MNKNLLIGAGVFVAVIIAGILFVGRPKTKTSSEVITQPTIETTSQDATGSEVKEITITGKEYSYSVSSQTLKVGDNVKVIFKNDGNMTHDLVIEELSLRTKVIAPGKSDFIEFIVPAGSSLTYFCSVSNHRALGMEGTFSIEQ